MIKFLSKEKVPRDILYLLDYICVRVCVRACAWTCVDTYTYIYVYNLWVCLCIIGVLLGPKFFVHLVFNVIPLSLGSLKVSFIKIAYLFSVSELLPNFFEHHDSNNPSTI